MNKLEEIEKQVELYEKNIESQQQSLETLKRELERLKAEKENEPWKPENGETYYYIEHEGSVCATEWNRSITNEWRYEIGNVFKSTEEAEFRVEQLKVEAELIRFARPFEENEQNVILKYAHDTNKLLTGHHLYSQYGNIYFASEEVAYKAIETVGEERIKKYYFGVKD